jgi:hypothetical protein
MHAGARPVPEISRFFGVVIRMHGNDHPPPHVHAAYGEQTAVLEIRSGEVLHGRLPPRARRLVVAWMSAHTLELLHDWDLLRRGLPPQPIRPLE